MRNVILIFTILFFSSSLGFIDFPMGAVESDNENKLFNTDENKSQIKMKYDDDWNPTETLEWKQYNEEKPTLHMLGIFYTIVRKEYYSCAFTAKVKKFSKMMQRYGWRVIEYGIEDTESEADVFVQVMTENELKSRLQIKDMKKELLGVDASVASAHYELFNQRLIQAVKGKIKAHDIVLYPFGNIHKEIGEIYKNAFHVESGIGYNNPGLNFRIYESYSWLHYCAGVEKSWG